MPSLLEGFSELASLGGVREVVLDTLRVLAHSPSATLLSGLSCGAWRTGATCGSSGLLGCMEMRTWRRNRDLWGAAPYKPAPCSCRQGSGRVALFLLEMAVGGRSVSSVVGRGSLLQAVSGASPIPVDVTLWSSEEAPATPDRRRSGSSHHFWCHPDESQVALLPGGAGTQLCAGTRSQVGGGRVVICPGAEHSSPSPQNACGLGFGAPSAPATSAGPASSATGRTMGAAARRKRAGRWPRTSRPSDGVEALLASGRRLFLEARAP